MNETTTTDYKQPVRFCRTRGILCSSATEFGYCKFTGCCMPEDLQFGQLSSSRETKNDDAWGYIKNRLKKKFGNNYRSLLLSDVLSEIEAAEKEFKRK
ncbi:MAG: hypothetical protein NC218_01680 [Acetobacter sp.]|nr:hypothetical protein [Acetobacter sp.]